jgi:hypothetical protein
MWDAKILERDILPGTSVIKQPDSNPFFPQFYNWETAL